MPFKSGKTLILCVEDYPDTCSLVAQVLREAEVVSADTIERAWELYASRKYSLISEDYHMPDGSGLDLLERIRARDFLTPVIVISGDGDLSEAAVKEAGGQRLVRKGHSSFVEDLQTAATALSVVVS